MLVVYKLAFATETKMLVLAHYTTMAAAMVSRCRII